MSQLPAGSTRPNKWIIAWLVALTFALFISLAGNAAWVQSANDPPVKVFQTSLDDVGAMAGESNGATVTSTTYTSVVQVISSQLSSNHPHACVAVGSVGVDNNGSGLYTIALGLDGSAAIGNTKREFELTNNADSDENFVEATTIHSFFAVSGAHSFHLLARKNSAGSAAMKIDEATLVVMCFKKIIGSE